jgi:small subunit ribosomal protein S9
VGEDQNEIVDADVQTEETSEAEGAGRVEPLWYWGTGRRKTSVARVRIRPGTGQVVVNKKPIEQFFPVERNRLKAISPLKTSKLEGSVDVFANCTGGGITGQADAMLMGLARALVEFREDLEPTMREAGHLTRDARKVERKKYGRAGARRRFQYSKR